MDDLLAIRGLGPKRLEKMRKYLVAGKTNSKNAVPAPSCSGCAKPKVPSAKPPGKASALPAAPKTEAEDEEPPEKPIDRFLRAKSARRGSDLAALEMTDGENAQQGRGVAALGLAAGSAEGGWRDL